MTTEKTAKEWFEMLKEPYRSQAIKASEEWPNTGSKKKQYNSLVNALLFDFTWGNNEPFVDWNKIYTSIENGETTYLADDNDTPSKEKLIEVLKELVELKTLKDEAGEYLESLLIHNYRERKDAAWKKAKDLIGKLPEPPTNN